VSFFCGNATEHSLTDPPGLRKSNATRVPFNNAAEQYRKHPPCTSPTFAHAAANVSFPPLPVESRFRQFAEIGHSLMNCGSASNERTSLSHAALAGFDQLLCMA
jgi:hypothetical protein